jgi:hypothetical protein
MTPIHQPLARISDESEHRPLRHLLKDPLAVGKPDEI